MDALKSNTPLNIVELMEKTPLTKLSETYNNKFINKIKEDFNEMEQQLFVSSFFCYLNYHPTNDYVIDLDNVWKWLGFSQKVIAKRTLKNNFIIEKDYKVLLYPKVKQTKTNQGGHNKETIMLNIKTFKLFCIKADTKRAKEVHEYFIKLEEILQEILQEETNELKEQLQKIQHIEINFNETLKKEKLLQRQQILLNNFATSGPVVYVIKVKTFDDGKYIIKIGQSAKGCGARYDEHKTKYPECTLIDCYSVIKCIDFEKYIHNHEKIRKYKYNKLDGHEKETELFIVGGGLTYDTINRIINENLKQFNEYTKADFELLETKIEKLETKIELLETEKMLLKQYLKEQKLYKEEIIEPQKEREPVEHIPENYIVKKLEQMESQYKEIFEQNKEILQTININKQSRLITGFGEINKTVGPRLLQINPETLCINKIYDTVADCLKDSNFKNKRPSIEKAVMENIIYNGYRWLYVERDKDPEEALATIQKSKDTKVQNIGYIAKLNKEKTIILNVYIDRKTASIQNDFPSPSSLDSPVKMGTIAKEHYYVLYDKCDDALKSMFIEKKGGNVPFLYKNGVASFDNNGNVIEKYFCKYDCIKKLQIGDKTLSKILDKNIPYNDRFYKSIASNLYV
jgi:hypothetical protein